MPEQPDGHPRDVVQLRSLLVAGMPLLVASTGRTDPSGLRDAVGAAGVDPIRAFVGESLPKGAKVGIVVTASELRLVDEQDRTLLTAPRDGLDDAWLDAARRLKGTMFVLVDDLDLSPTHDPATLAQLVHRTATAGRARGAIVGVVEDRPRLPMLFG